jgi:hypothetical protein
LLLLKMAVAAKVMIIATTFAHNLLGCQLRDEQLVAV